MAEYLSESQEEHYEQALAYLNQFINYERKMAEVYAPEKMDPERPGRLLAHLGNPHRRYPSIHIAGTKGKGSVAAMSAFCLREAGLRVGLYTSPHLQDLRERMRILTKDDPQGLIPVDRFVELVDRLPALVEQVPAATWFELVTALAFLYFAEEEVDVAVIEVGLGGRLDATNVLLPLVSVITRLGLEHTALLGNTLAEIAGEKAGIIKQGVPVVSSPQKPEALAQLAAIAVEREAPLTVVGQEWQYTTPGESPDAGRMPQTITIVRAPAAFGRLPATFALGLAGAHQQENAVTALAALQHVRSRFPSLDRRALKAGLATVQWPGRLQTLYEGPGGPTILLDGAHNSDSAERLAQALEQYEFRRLWLVLGATGDKNIKEIFRPLLELATGIVVTQAGHPRAATPQRLQAEVEELGFSAAIEADVAAAVQRVWQAAGPDDLLCVTGSLFVVGDLLNYWESLKSLLLGTESSIFPQHN